MKKILVLLLVLALALPTIAIADSNELHVLSWLGYVDSDTLTAFEAETGIKVVWSPMESPEDMLLKLNQSGGKGYDLILSSDYSLDVLRKEGLIQAFDKTQLPNYTNIDESFLNQPYDPNNEYVIPYTAGCIVIIYDPSVVTEPITSYNDLWREDLADSIALIDNGRVVGGLVLKSLGYSINETDETRLNEMQEKLMSLYPNIRTFGDDATYSALVTGDASVSLTYAAFAGLAYKDNPDLKVVYPSEGLGFGIDGFVLSSQSENVDSAHRFMNWLMRPEVAAHNAQFQSYTNVNKAATPLLSEEYLNNPIVSVPHSALEGAEIIMDLGAVSTRYQEIFDALKLQ